MLHLPLNVVRFIPRRPPGLVEVCLSRHQPPFLFSHFARSEEGGGNSDLADDFSDYTMSVLTHVSAMYNAVLKLPRSALQGPQQATTSRLLAEV